MNPIHFDINREIRDLDQVVDKRLELAKQERHANETRPGDLLVCIRNRSLFSRFVDTALWPGVDDATVVAVRQALQRAFDCLNNDEEHADVECLKSVKDRLDAFDKFLSEGLPTTHSTSRASHEVALD